MASPSAEHELPLRAAGGGQPSEDVAHTTIARFSQGGPVLSHLRNVYQNLTRGEAFQEMASVKDEEAFLSYMSSPQAAALAPPPTASQDLGYPLSSYYISSSHNTYLSGHQLYGEASTEAYTNVLNRGCRCLEIDVWDGEESDTSASGSDEDEEDTGAVKAKPKPKSSRWSRMKARAVAIRGSSPSRHKPLPVPSQGDASSASQPSNSDRLSPSMLSEQQSLKAEPRVLHGYTLTQSVPFRAVCHSIRESAFTASRLPLIVSLEVHANLDQQQMMVEIMKEAWKGHLVDLTSIAEKDIDSLPSPDSVRNKILIKVKWTPNNQTGESNDPLEHIKSNTTEGSTDNNPAHAQTKQKKASKVLQTLSELGVYTRAYTFKHWDQPEASIPTHVFSLSEGKVHDMHGDPSHGPALFDHNRNFLMRVFPRGTRIRSSNVDPTFHWRQGAQMVALNWQRLDKGMMLNEGMFSGQEGWVLKPEGYWAARPAADKTAEGPAKVVTTPKKHLLDLKIQLLSAQELPLPLEKESSHRAKIKPYVKLQLHVDTHGPPGQGGPQSAKAQSDAYGEEDKEEKKYKYRSKTQKSDSPNFEGETVAWNGVVDVVEELSFLRLKIKDDRAMGADELSCWACIRLDRLQTGLRFIHLLDARGLQSRGVLLVRITKTLC